MGRPSNKAERRAQIAMGLIQVMAERGYDKASIKEIAAAADLTQGLVHHHFKNKLEILLAALEELRTAHEDRLIKALDTAGSEPRAKLGAFIDFHLALKDTAHPESLASWLVISGEAIRESTVRAAFSDVLLSYRKVLMEIIQDGVETKCFRDNVLEDTASAILAAIQGYFVLAATAPDLIPPGSAARSVKKMAEGLLECTLSTRRPE